VHREQINLELRGEPVHPCQGPHGVSRHPVDAGGDRAADVRDVDIDSQAGKTVRPAHEKSLDTSRAGGHG
jgi:hypothetical protein